MCVACQPTHAFLTIPAPHPQSLAVSGLSVVGRDAYGVFPLKGKLLNVREATPRQVAANAEIQALVTILGLKYGVEYDDAKALRYGHLMIMADQDHDGRWVLGQGLGLLRPSEVLFAQPLTHARDAPSAVTSRVW